MTNVPWAAYAAPPSSPQRLSLKSRKTTLSAQAHSLTALCMNLLKWSKRLNLSAEWVAAQLAITRKLYANRCDDFHHDYVNETNC